MTYTIPSTMFLKLKIEFFFNLSQSKSKSTTFGYISGTTKNKVKNTRWHNC